MADVKKYVIGEKTFIQRRLVWGQVKQLIKEIEGVELPSSPTPRDILTVFEAKLPRLVGIMLIPEGQTAKSKNIDEMIELFEWELGVDQIMEIIEDFFDCNPIPLWLEKVNKGMGKLTSGIESFSGKETGLTEMLQSSQEVISQNETT